MFTFNITPDCFLTGGSMTRPMLIIDPRETPVTVRGTTMQTNTTTQALRDGDVFSVAVPADACGELVKEWCEGEGREVLQRAVQDFQRGDFPGREVEEALWDIPRVLRGEDVIDLAFEDPFSEIGRDLADAQRRAARGLVDDPVAEAVEMELNAIEDWVDMDEHYARLHGREAAADAIRAYIESVDLSPAGILDHLEYANVLEQALEDPVDWSAIDAIEETAPDSEPVLRHLIAFARAQGFKSLQEARQGV